MFQYTGRENNSVILSLVGSRSFQSEMKKGEWDEKWDENSGKGKYIYSLFMIVIIW